jgi:HEAT repeat protein
VTTSPSIFGWMIRREHGRVLVAAVAAWGQVGGEDAEAVPMLAKHARGRDRDLAVTAVAALASGGRTAPAAVDALVAALNHQDQDVRRGARQSRRCGVPDLSPPTPGTSCGWS